MSEESRVKVASVVPVVPLPRWVLILAAISALSLLGGAAGGVGAIVYFRRAALDSINPAYITETLKRIGGFPDAAAGGYHPQVAIRVPGLVEGVGFGDNKDSLQFDFFIVESDSSDPDPAEQIDLWYERPVVFPFANAKFISVADKGKADINGREFVYEVGVLKDVANGQTRKGLIGCLVHGRKVLMAVAMAPPGQPMDVDAVVGFLRKGQSF